MKDRADKFQAKEDYYKQIETLQQEQEQKDREAWMGARGTSSAVPLAKRLKKHQDNHMKLREKKKDLYNEQDGEGGGEHVIILPSNGSQKRGVFAGERTQQGRYLLARPGSAHTTKGELWTICWSVLFCTMLNLFFVDFFRIGSRSFAIHTDIGRSQNTHGRDIQIETY